MDRDGHHFTASWPPEAASQARSSITAALLELSFGFPGPGVEYNSGILPRVENLSSNSELQTQPIQDVGGWVN